MLVLATLTPFIIACGPDPSAPTGDAASTPGDLRAVRNPYTGDADAIAQGEQLFAAKACSSCHGATAAGAMCPSLVNDTWVYGSDDTTLFNLIRLGSSGLQARGRTRIGHEPQVGDMPPFSSVVSDDEAWKLIAYVRSKYTGDPALRNW